MTKQQAARTLGVPPDADEATLTRAYRRLALRHHPDRGGEAKDFQAVQDAYDTLNGRAKEPQDTNLPAPAKILSDCMVAILDQLASQGRDARYVDVVGLMRDGLRQATDNHRKQIESLKRQQRSLELMKERATHRGEGDNLLVLMSEAHLANIVIQIRHLEQFLLHIGEAREMLKEYDYRKDESYAASTTSATTGRYVAVTGFAT